MAPVICYESVYGEYSTGYIKKGAQAIFIMTNDGWWDNTAGHRQHLYFASLRAIEARRAIARSANTGISAFVNQRGDILQPTRYDEPIAIKTQYSFQRRHYLLCAMGRYHSPAGYFFGDHFITEYFCQGAVEEEGLSWIFLIPPAFRRAGK